MSTHTASTASRKRATWLAIVGLIAVLVMPIVAVLVRVFIPYDWELPAAANLLVCGGTGLWMGIRSACGRSARGMTHVRVLGWIVIATTLLVLPFSLPWWMKM